MIKLFVLGVIIGLLQANLIVSAEQEPTRSEIDPSPTPSSRIISEGHIDITYRPYQAAVAHYYQYIVCGAAIISQSWVLTAKKCVQFIHQEDIQIVVGATSLRPELEYGSIREVYSIECHSYANIAAVQLRYSLEFSDKIQNIYLCYDCGHPTVGTEATVSGYGALMINNYNVGVLRSVKVQIVDHFDCKKTYDDIGLVVSIQEICAMVFGGDTDGSESFYRRDGPCLGDAGSPLVDENTKELLGIVSIAESCGSHKYPSVYVQISHPAIQNWIRSITAL